jgi:hypothetical protein
MLPRTHMTTIEHINSRDIRRNDQNKGNTFISRIYFRR